MYFFLDQIFIQIVICIINFIDTLGTKKNPIFGKRDKK